jgi:hypothetical protein
MARRIMLLAVLGALEYAAHAGADEAKGVRAGAYAQDITPEKFPVSVNGGFQDRQATAAHDRLHARCLVLASGKMEVAIVIVDSCMLPRDLVREAKKQAEERTGIPATHMLIAATHTHTAPTVAGVFQSEPDAAYVELLPRRIAQGIEKAHKNLMPARVGWAVGKDPTQLFNRRWKMKPGSIAPDPFGNTTDQVKMNPGYQVPGLVDPAGPTDPDVSIVAVQTRDGRPMALLANYSLHYVGGFPPLSADYFAAFAERIGQLIGAGDGFVGIMSNGTSGDVNNINFAGPAPKGQQPGDQIRIVADSVAKAAFEAYQSVKYHDDLTLGVAWKDIELGVRKPSEQDVARAKDILEKAKDKKQLTTPAEVYARETVLLAKYPGTVEAEMQALRIGDLGIVAIPCEVFTEIGLHIKKRSPLKPTFTIELANGYNGYLPTPAQHRLGGYETWRARSSYLEVDASTKITGAVLGLLKEVAP